MAQPYDIDVVSGEQQYQLGLSVPEVMAQNAHHDERLPRDYLDVPGEDGEDDLDPPTYERT